MRARLQTAGLAEIADKVESRVRLSFEDGVTLFESTDLLALGWIANRERERRHGDRTYLTTTCGSRPRTCARRRACSVRLRG